MTWQEKQFYSAQIMDFASMENLLQNQQIMSHDSAYMILLAQLAHQSTIKNIPYPSYLQVDPINCCCAETFNKINCCCAETFNKINATCSEREKFIDNNLKSCVQTYPKVKLEKPNQEDKENKKLLNGFKIFCVLLAIISRFISHIAVTIYSPLLKLLNLGVYAVVIALLLAICSLEKSQ